VTLGIAAFWGGSGGCPGGSFDDPDPWDPFPFAPSDEGGVECGGTDEEEVGADAAFRAAEERVVRREDDGDCLVFISIITASSKPRTEAP
jgi:hypothetical protein